MTKLSLRGKKNIWDTLQESSPAVLSSLSWCHWFNTTVLLGETPQKERIYGKRRQKNERQREKGKTKTTPEGKKKKKKR